MKYDKLVRDKIPEIIQRKGSKPITYIAGPEEFRTRLAEQLVEEAPEFKESGEFGELADVLEVIDAICESQFTSSNVLKVMQGKKARERGRFRKRIVLDEVG